MESTQKEIDLKTIVWFDVFDWPLTKIEIQKYAGIKNFNEYLKDIPDAIENFNGFYFLKNRSGTTPYQSLPEEVALRPYGAGRHGTGLRLADSVRPKADFVEPEAEVTSATQAGQAQMATPNNAEIVKKRILRQKIAIKKIKIGKFAAEILSFVPFVKMIAICNDLAYFNAPGGSDIDFFIVVKSGRMWTARFLATFIIFVLGLWRHGKKIKDRICLSFFVADDNLNLKNIAYDDDIYLKYWILQILPLFDKENAYQKFLNENSWATDEFLNFFQNIPSLKIRVQPKFLQMVFEKILEGFSGNFLEKILKTIQVGIMRKEIPYQKGRDVIISDKMLKFHEKDRRKYFRDIFKKRLIETAGNL